MLCMCVSSSTYSENRHLKAVIQAGYTPGLKRSAQYVFILFYHLDARPIPIYLLIGGFNKRCHFFF